MSEVTQILFIAEQGDAQTTEQLLSLVYQELRPLAEAIMARETPDQTLHATTLVHEVRPASPRIIVDLENTSCIQF